MGELEKYISQEYDGTLEGVRLLVKNLKLEPSDFTFDIKDLSISIWKEGIRYRPGDYYIYPFEEEK